MSRRRRRRRPARPLPLRRGSASGVVLVVGLLLAGCGEGGDDPAATGATTTTGAGPSGAGPTSSGEASSTGAAHGEADVAFLRRMVPHHEQATEMAALVDGRTQDEDVVALAEQVHAEQQPEIEEMTALLESYGEPVPSSGATGDGMDGMGGMDGMDMETGGTDEGSGTAGMMSAQDMDALRSASGDDFDRRWLSMMVEHHQGAVTMAHTELAEGQDPDAQALAGQVVDAQEAQIATMQELLAAG